MPMSMSRLDSRKKTIKGVNVDAYIATAEFSKDATERPDVYLLVIGKTKDDFGSTIRTGLDIGAEIVCLKAAASYINHLHLTPAVALYQDVFWFQVAVDQAQPMQEFKCL